MSRITGLACTLSVGGNTISYIRNVTVDVKGDVIDETTRASGGWKEKIIGLLEWTASFEMVHDTSGSGDYATIVAAMTARTAVTAIFTASGEGSGYDTMTGTCYITAINRTEPMGGESIKSKITIEGAGALTWS